MDFIVEIKGCNQASFELIDIDDIEYLIGDDTKSITFDDFKSYETKFCDFTWEYSAFLED